MELKSNQSRLLINLQGGKIEELVLDDVKILGTYDRIDGKTGSTHICVPNFASEGTKEYGLPFHGPARNLEWQVVNQSENSLEIKVIIEALEKYKSSLEVTQIFTLSPCHLAEFHEVPINSCFPIGDSSKAKERLTFRSDEGGEIPCFAHEVHVKNIGTVAVPVNIGIHNYFDTPNGWQNARLNNKNIKEEIEKNLSVSINPPVQLSGYADDESALLDSSAQGGSTRRVTFLSFERSRELSQHDRSLAQKSIRVVTQGASEFVTWSGVKDGKYDSRYACIEPVISFDSNYFGSETSLLYPDKSRIMSQTISLA